MNVESYLALVWFVACMNASVNEKLVSSVERSPASRAVRPAAVESTCDAASAATRPPTSSLAPQRRVRLAAVVAVFP